MHTIISSMPYLLYLLLGRVSPTLLSLGTLADFLQCLSKLADYPIVLTVVILASCPGRSLSSLLVCLFLLWSRAFFAGAVT